MEKRISAFINLAICIYSEIIDHPEQKKEC